MNGFKDDNMKLLLAITSIIFICSTSYSQNTLSFNDSTGSPKATLEDIKWIEGHWRGEAFGGITEEIWSPPLGGSMMCAFKLVVDGKVQFYEICVISEENNTIILRLKHFHPDLKGWEKQDETRNFRLVKVTDNAVYFEGFTFKKKSKDEIVLYVVIKNEGKIEEVEFNYKRQKC